MPRAFTAIDIPPEIAEKLSNIQEEIEVGRPVNPEKMHITFEFFKELPQGKIEELEKHLQELEFQPFTIQVQGLGVFPSEKYIRVIWAGINSENIHSLHEEVSDHSLNPDNGYEFQPHVTISRVDDVRRGDKKRIHDALEKYSEQTFGTFTAEKVKLYRSDLKAEGSEYTELYVKNL